MYTTDSPAANVSVRCAVVRLLKIAAFCLPFVTGVYPAGVDTPMLRHEATHGGSALNFVGKPVEADEIARAYERALGRPRLEVYVPYSESLTSRLAGAFPWILGRLYPLLTWMGEKGRAKFLKRIA